MGIYCCAVLYSGEKEDVSQRQDEDQDADIHKWTSTLQLHTDVTPPPAQPLAVDPWQQPVTASLSPDGSPHADRSPCPPAPQVRACLIPILLHLLTFRVPFTLTLCLGT